jgi:hypothetical protein
MVLAAPVGSKVYQSRLAGLNFLEVVHLTNVDVAEEFKARVIELTGVPDEDATSELCMILAGLAEMARDSLDPAWNDDALRQAIAERRGSA